MFKKLAVLAVTISLLLAALPTHADGPITLGMGRLTAIALSPDGGRLAVGTTGGVYFYDSQSFAPLGYWDIGDPVEYLRWSPRDDMLAVEHNYGQVDFRSPLTGAILWSTKSCYRCAIVFDSDGSQVAVATSHAASSRFDSITGALLEVATGYLGPRVDWLVSLSPDRQWQASADFGGDISLHLAAGSHSRDVVLPNAHGSLSWDRTLAWSPDSRILYVGGDNAVKVWDVETSQQLRVLSGFSTAVEKVIWSADSRHLISAEGERLVLSDVATRLPIQTSELTAGAIQMALSPTGHLIAAANWQGIVTIHDAATLQEITRFDVGRYVRVMAISPDEKYLVTAGDSPFVNVWEISSGKAKKDLLGSVTTSAILAVAYSPDGQSLYALESGGILRDWNLSTGASTTIALAVTNTPYRRNFGAINLVSKRVIVESTDSIVVLDATTGQQLYTLPVTYSGEVTIDNPGQRLAIGDLRTIRIVDLGTGSLIANYPSPSIGFINSLAFSPDGHSLVSASDYSQFNGATYVWPVP